MVEKVEKGARIASALCVAVWMMTATFGYLYALLWFVVPAYLGVVADMGNVATLITMFSLMGLVTMGGFGILVVGNAVGDGGAAFIDKGLAFISATAARFKSATAVRPQNAYCPKCAENEFQAAQLALEREEVQENFRRAFPSLAGPNDKGDWPPEGSEGDDPQMRAFLHYIQDRKSTAPDHFTPGEIAAAIGIDPRGVGILVQKAFPGVKMVRGKGYSSKAIYAIGL